MSTPTGSEKSKGDEAAKRTPERVTEFHRLRRKYEQQMRPLAESIDRSQRLSWRDLMTTINC